MHLGIFGTSKSGKSTLGRLLIADMVRRRRPVLVLDPFNDPAFTAAGATMQTDSLDQLESQMRRTPDATVLIEEAYDLKGDKRLETFARKWRHSGHNIIYSGQRPKDCVPGIRTNIDAVYLLRGTFDDYYELSNEIVRRECQEAAELPKGHWLYVPKFGEVRRGDVSPFFGKI